MLCHCCWSTACKLADNSPSLVTQCNDSSHLNCLNIHLFEYVVNMCDHTTSPFCFSPYGYIVSESGKLKMFCNTAIMGIDYHTMILRIDYQSEESMNFIMRIYFLFAFVLLVSSFTYDKQGWILYYKHRFAHNCVLVGNNVKPRNSAIMTEY